MIEQLKKLGEIRIEEDISIEELQAIRKILVHAGLLVEVRGRELLISVKERDW